MKKTSTAAIALAAALTATGSAHAAKTEKMIIADFQTSVSDSEPKVDAQGNLVTDKDGNPVFESKTTYNPRLREAKACVANAQGQQFTLTINFMLVASIQDLGISIDKNMSVADAASQVVAKFPPAQADKAAAYIDQAWKAIGSRHKLEEIATNKPSPEFLQDLQKTFSDLADGKRIQPDVKSFEEETGITIGVGGILPGPVTPGCAR
jgi:hypothetical protein